MLWNNGSRGYLFVLICAVVAAISFVVTFFREPSIFLGFLSAVFVALGFLVSFIYRIAREQEKKVNSFLAKSGFTKLLPKAELRMNDGKLLGLRLVDKYFSLDNGEGYVVIGGICAPNIIYHHFSFENRDEDMMVIREVDSEYIFTYGK